MQKMLNFGIQVSILSSIAGSFLQAPLLYPPSLVLASLKISVELWMSLWTGHWVVETVLISTSSTLPPMLPIPPMEDFWTSPLPVSHCHINWPAFIQTTSTTLQYVVSTVGGRRGVRASPWQSDLKVSTFLDIVWLIEASPNANWKMDFSFSFSLCTCILSVTYC